MSKAEELRKALQRFNQQPKQSRVCKVIAINEENETIDAEPLDGGAPFDDVRLNAIITGEKDSFTLMPAMDSFVIVTLISNNESDAFVSLATKFKWMRMQLSNDAFILIKDDGNISLKGVEIELNGNAKGGIAIVSKIVEKLNQLEQRMATHQHGYLPTGATIPVPTTPDLATNSPITPTTAQELENSKVKHG